MRNGTRLTESIRLLHLRPQSLIHRENKLLAQRRRARSDHFQRREIELLHHGRFREVQYDRRCDVGVRDLVVLDDGAEFGEIEGGHDDRGESCERG